MGQPGGRRLLLFTALGALALLLILVLALPGEPQAWWSGLKGVAQKTSVLIPLATLAAVAMLACLRSWEYRSLQYRPGPIQVLGIDDASVPGENRDSGVVAHLDVHFRQVLSDLRLSATSPAPGVSSSTDFVELLETSKLDAKQPFAVVGRLLRIVRPTHAYEVRATLVHRELRPCFGAVVEVAVLPGRRTTLHTYWRDSFEVALERAATGVAAVVIPRSRHSDSGVWARWKGLEIDEDLVDLYQEAERFRGARRFEESLARLYEAVRRDPTNGHLRLTLGATQEDLTLYVDALTTYRSIPHVTHGWRAAHPSAAKRIELVANYRQAKLLGLGEGMAVQWLTAVKRGKPSRRMEELKRLRTQLLPVFQTLFSECAVSGEDRQLLALGADPDAGLDRLLTGRPVLEGLAGIYHHTEHGRIPKQQAKNNRLLRERRLQLLFQLLAKQEIGKVVQQAGEVTFDEANIGLTRLCFDLLPVWADVRLRYARERLAVELRQQSHTPDDPDAVGEWPPTPEQIREFAQRSDASLQTRLAGSRSFDDHYAMACIFAVCLLPTREKHPETSPERLALAQEAVAELRKAVDAGGSDALAKHWDAILSNDPDLASLRMELVFEQFESEWMPSARSIKGRPKQIARLNASRYNAFLCTVCASELERVWQYRVASERRVEAATAQRWLRHEADAWRLAGELAHHHRHWQTRLVVIEQIQRFNHAHGGTGLSLAHPRYHDDPDGPKAGTEESTRDLRMNALAAVLAKPDEPLPGFEAWSERLKLLDESGVPLTAKETRDMAENRASAWRHLRQAFERRLVDQDGDTQPELEQSFADAVGELTKLVPGELRREPSKRFDRAAARKERLRG